jgi:hypothetical protein
MRALHLPMPGSKLHEQTHLNVLSSALLNLRAGQEKKASGVWKLSS